MGTNKKKDGNKMNVMNNKANLRKRSFRKKVLIKNELKCEGRKKMCK